MTMIKASVVGPRLASVQCASPAGLHRMAYRQWGDPDNSDVVVCVHGLTRISNDFDTLAQALAHRFRVICPDVVGRGESSWLSDPMLYGVPQYVADMVTLIARLNVASVRWVGTSMGGLIGMTLASITGTPVSRLVLNDVGAKLSGQALGRIAAYVGSEMVFDSRQQAHEALRSIFSGFGPHSDEQWERLLDDMLRPASGAAAKDGQLRLHYDPAIAEPFRRSYGQKAADSSAHSGSGPQDLELWPIYDRISCPTLVLRGAESDLLSAQVAQEMTRRGPKASLVEFAGVGHAPTLMHADQIEAVRAFLTDDRLS